jgi:NAD(P)-dependent dehydrogenase (short-subunit alcohol dehydrogenase family)
MRHVLVTGVSSGIGQAAAADLARHGFCVLGSVRRDADAAPLLRMLGERFVPLLFDVTDAAAVRRAADRARAAVGPGGLCGLVNNAGIAVAGPLLHLAADDLRRQMEVSLIGVLNVVQAFFPLLRMPGPDGRPGRIVNISSVSGRFASPFLGPYAASKHALEALSDSLRRELMMYGVDVIVIEPGRVRTPIWDRVAGMELGRFADTDYGPTLQGLADALPQRLRSALPPEAVARVIRRALTARHPRARYPVPDQWLSGWLLPRWMPDRWMDRMFRARLKPCAGPGPRPAAG